MERKEHKPTKAASEHHVHVHVHHHHGMAAKGGMKPKEKKAEHMKPARKEAPKK